MTSVEVLQASVYGIGVCAEYGGAAFKPLVGGGKLKLQGFIYSFVKLSQLKCSVVLGRWWEVQWTCIWIICSFIEGLVFAFLIMQIM